MSKPIQKKICRVCLQSEKFKSVSIFNNYESISILYAIENISDLKDLRFDNFTKLVCLPCAEDVVAAYKTKIRCLESDAFLRGIFDSQNNSESEGEAEPASRTHQHMDIDKIEEDVQTIKLEQPTHNPILVIEPDEVEFENHIVEAEDIEEDCLRTIDKNFKEESFASFDDYIIDETSPPPDSSEPDDSQAEDAEYEEVDEITESKTKRRPYQNSLYFRSCCQCVEMFETESELIAHFTATHAQCVKHHIELQGGHTSQSHSRTQCILCRKIVRQIHTHRRRKHFKDYQDGHVRGSNQSKLYLRSCCQCPKLFNDEKEVFAHFATAHAERVKHNNKLLPPNDKQKQCVLCYRLVRNIHTHRRRMHSKDYQARGDQAGDSTYSCNLCDIRFTTRKKLDSHNQYNHSDETTAFFQEVTACPLCGVETNSPCLLDKHLLKEHPESKCIECKVCNKKLKLATSLRKHLMAHDTVLECDQCKEVFGSVVDLQEHEILHTNKPLRDGTETTAPRVVVNEIVIENRYPHEPLKKAEKDTTKQHFCCKCTNTYDDETELLEHFNETHLDKVRFHYDDVFSKAEDQTQCTLCLGYVKDMYRHRRNKHDRGSYKPRKDFQCTNCGKVYRTGHGMKQCERKHLGLPTERVQCPQCPVTLANRMNLVGHMKLHSKLFRYECELCGRQFKKGTNLKKHLNTTHSDERNVKCDVCGKTMKTKSSLSMHMRIHTGERPYQCKYCSNTYMHPTDCKRHEMVHTGYRPYTCDICDKGFIKRSSLVEHKKIHGHGEVEDV